MDNCKRILADGFGVEAYKKVDITFYMDLAAVAARLDFDASSMTEPQKELVRECWNDLLSVLDATYASQTDT